MAEEQKKSFVLYFDMYPSIRVLPADQKGMLLGAVFEYAQSAAERDITPEEIMARYPDMSQACSMAFRFVAETIRRDTEKWKAKHKRYSEAAKVRWEKGSTPAKAGTAEGAMRKPPVCGNISTRCQREGSRTAGTMSDRRFYRWSVVFFPKTA